MSIPVLSLAVAALAVFFGPLVSILIAKRQVGSALETANKQITAPMRQAWINSLRELLAELAGNAMHYYVAGYEEKTYEEYRRLTYLEAHIQLMLNSLEGDHQKLEQLIRKMLSSLSRGKDGDQDFEAAHAAMMALSRQVLKREWNVIKGPIKPS